MLIKRIAALWRRLTNAGRLLIFIPAMGLLLLCWAVSMLFVAVTLIGEGQIKRLVDRMDKFLVKDLE